MSKSVQISYFIKPNAYRGKCFACGAPVAEREGFVQKDRESGKFVNVCHACVREHGRFTPITSRDGSLLHGKSVVRGSAQLVTCNRCGSECGFVKSKAGKFYLAETAPSYGESRATRVYDFKVHDKDACQRVLDLRAEESARSEAEETKKALAREYHAKLDAARGDRDEIIRLLDEYREREREAGVQS